MAAVDNGPRNDCCCNSPRLTKGEINVLLAIASGMTSKRAAATLRLSKSTIDGHVDAMRHKAGVSTRGELLAVAVARAIIDLTGGTPRWTGRSCLAPRPAHAESAAFRPQVRHSKNLGVFRERDGRPGVVEEDLPGRAEARR